MQEILLEHKTSEWLGGRKWSDSGHILKADPTKFAGGEQDRKDDSKVFVCLGDNVFF